ncbi:MAG TPA: energy transducer TonB [Terriglobia bacterium]|nr:energy transducer TonB [Terriglobia bacterium]
MFDQTLLDSSPDRAPVLSPVHWAISIGLGVLGFLAWYFLVTLFLGRPDSNATLALQSFVFGFIPLFIMALMLSYVYADTRRMHFNTALWFILTLVLNVLGFLIYLIYSANKTKNWKRATMPIAYILECIAVGVMLLIPLIYTQGLPKAQLMTYLAAPPPPPPAPAPPPPAAPKVVIHKVSLADLMKAPTVIPKKIVQVHDEPQPSNTGVVGGVPGGVPGGVAGGVPGGMMMSSAPPPPPPPKPKAPAVVRVGGQVEAARGIYNPTPVYPPLAKMARVQGEVRLSAVISKDGTIQDLKVISGHPLLIQAALSAVRQWRYEPYLLDGVPVVVDTEIDVNFTLSE